MRKAVAAGVLTLGLTMGAGAAWAWSPARVPVVACLDVGVPPGLPFEWEQPGREPTQSLHVPKAKVEEGDPKATRIRRSGPLTESRPRIYTERTTAMGYARVTTVDILTHFQWAEGPQTDLVETPTGRTATGVAAGPETLPAYPPKITLDVYWVSMAIYLRALLHPNQISDAESIERLVEMGFPAMCVLHDVGLRPISKNTNTYVQNMALAKQRLKRWQGALRKRVGPLPPKKPRAIQAPSDAERNMLLRVAADDLAAGYASALDPNFAGRVLSLPIEEGAPLLLAYATPNAHTLLRRNAASLLGGYRGPEVRATLERLVASSNDDVTQLRAYAALGRQGSAEARKLALARAKSVPAIVAVHTLGILRAPEGSKLALKLLRKGSSDELMVAFRALGRMGDDGKKVRSALKSKVKKLRKLDPKKLWELAAFRADVPDTVQMRRDTLVQLGWIAMARLGDADAKKKVFAVIDADPAAPGGNRPFAGRNPLAARETFGAFLVPTLSFLVESLEHMGAEGEAALRRVVADRICDTGLRLAAWRALDRCRADTAELAKAMLDDGKVAVRADALRRHAIADPDDARTRAKTLLQRGLSDNAQELIAAADLFGDAAGSAKDAGSEAQVLRRGVFLHAAPNRASKKLCSVPTTKVLVFGEPKGGWIEAEYTPRGKEKLRGWIQSNMVRVDPSAASPDTLLAKVLAKVPPVAELAKAPKTPTPGMSGNPTLVIQHPLGEALAKALAGFDSEVSREALANYLTKEDQAPQARAAAAAALASSRDKSSREALLKALGAKDGWVRYAAFRALRHQGAKLESFCDWVYGEVSTRQAAIEKLKAWAAR
jgi:HEAT repeat protein